MPKGGGRGGKRSHKGQSKHYITADEIRAKEEKQEKEKAWRRDRGIPSDSDESGDEDGAAAKKDIDFGDETDSEEEVEQKKKGVQHLIQVSNPNHAAAANRMKKVSALQDLEGGAQLSRREREELEKQQAQAQYRKLHSAGKTEEARADLARLAIIRKQREEQQKKKAEEMKARDDQKRAAEEKLLERKKAHSKK